MYKFTETSSLTILYLFCKQPAPPLALKLFGYFAPFLMRATGSYFNCLTR